MKIYNKSTCIVLIAFLMSLTTFAQQQDFVVIKEDNSNSSKIRWMPTSYHIWKSGIEHGYTIVRLTETEEGTIKDTLVQGLKPLAENKWDSMFPNIDEAKTAKMMLYDMTVNTAPTQVSNLKDAMDVQEQNEGRHLFAMMSAEANFDVAKAQALGYEDLEGGSDILPTYIVTISNELAMQNLNFGISNIGYIAENLEAIYDLKSDVDENYAVLSWDTKEFANRYSSWNIERSLDGENFVKINQKPFIHGYTSDAYEYIASYQDPVQDCEGEYFYRVVGITPFGTTGPPSNHTNVQCINSLLIPLYINGTQEKNGGLLVNWRSFDEMYEDNIQGFNLYRTPELTKQLVKLNTDLLPASARDFFDSAPLSSGYYFLEAIDINNDPHRSNEFFTQIYDSQAPSSPTGLAGEFHDPQKLTVTWASNSESDMHGYNISVANHRSGKFTKWNDAYLKGTSFVVKFDKNFITDSVFVKLTALDNFYNASDYSEVLAVKRPDVFGPSDPILEFAYPTPDGVALGWSYSASDDVVKHKLQRRLKDQFDWKDILIISKENESKFDQNIPVAVSDANANHIDSHDQKAQEYHYRLVAIDDAGNTSPSKWLTVTPFPTAKITAIKDFEVVILREELPIDPKLEEQLVNMDSENLDDQLEAAIKTICFAQLSWTCELDERIAGFVLYRSMSGSSFKPIKQLSLGTVMGLEDSSIEISDNIGKQYLHYQDKDLKKGNRYSYYVVAKYKNGAESERSTIITKKL